MKYSDKMDIPNCNNVWNEKLIPPGKNKYLLSKLCRLCGNADKYLIPICGREGLEKDLRGKIEKHLSLLVNNHLPLHICYRCANTVITWHDITENISKVDDKFRTILEEIGYLNEEDCGNASEVVHLAAFEFDGVEKQTSFNGNVTEEINVPSRNEITRSQEQENESLSSKKAEEKLLSASFTLFEHPDVKTVEIACVEEGIIFSHPEVSCNPSTEESQTKYYSIEGTPSDGASFSYAVEPTKSSVFCGSQSPRIEEIHEAVTIGNLVCVLAENSIDYCDSLKFDHNYILKDNSSESIDLNDLMMSDSETTGMSTVIQNLPSENWNRHLQYKLKIMKRGGNRTHVVHWLWKRKKGVMHCENCFSSFQNESVLLTHSRFHSKQTPFYCKFCGKTFYLNASLKQHHNHCPVKENKEIACVSSNSHEESKNQYTCDICYKTFKLRGSLKDHYMQHVGKARCKLKCEKCGAKFLRKAEVLEHVKTHNNSVLTCEICNKVVLNEKDLQYHRITHSNVRPYTCNICKLTYKRKSHLTRHLRIHAQNTERLHLALTGQKGCQEHKCEVCDKICGSRTLLAMHTVTHTGERNYECSLCSKRFVQSGGLSRHFHTVHGRAKKFVCEICDQRFTAKATLKNHRRIHTGEKPFQCVHCGRTFRTRQQRKLHEQIHSDVRPFPCPYCSKRFRRRPHLVVHIRTHTGEKPYRCIVCERGFAQKNDMTKHMNVHKKDNYNLSFFASTHLLPEAT